MGGKTKQGELGDCGSATTNTKDRQLALQNQYQAQQSTISFISDDEDASDLNDALYQQGPKRSIVARHLNVAPGLDVITSHHELQVKMDKRAQKQNQSTLGKALKKTKIWVKEAITGEAVFSDDDWEENLAREAALEKMKKKKVKGFKRDMIRKSQAIGIHADEVQDIIQAFESKPLRLSAHEAALVEAETQRLLDESREARDEEDQVRQLEREIAQAQKLPSRLSLAVKALTQGTKKTTNELINHPHFDETPSAIDLVRGGVTKSPFGNK